MTIENRSRYGALYVAHHQPGRLRVRSRALEDDPRRRDAVEAVAAMGGVLAVHDRRETGGILVIYEPEQVDVAVLLQRLSAAARLCVRRMDGPFGPSARRTVQAVGAADWRLRRMTEGRLDLRHALPAVLGLGSFASFFWSGQPRSPRWETLLYWAMTHFAAHQASDVSERAHVGDFGR